MKQHAMKQNELDLLHRYLDGAITPDELETLEDLLRSNAEARATLRSLATIDAKWQQLAENEAAPWRTLAACDENTPDAASWKRTPLWLAAIAASLIVGAFGWFRGSGETPTETKLGIA